MTVTDTYLLLRAFVDELGRCGMRHACTCPGSRNTPLVLTLAAEPRIRAWSHIDERCAGFFALGAAKASGAPVAVTVTSGTAVANLFPAVIEAHEARVPLIVLSADRPPELRDVGAGQTIDQLKLFGGAVKWFFEVGVHEASEANLRWMRTLACRAHATAVAGRPGPVHLNFPLREPLVLDQPLPEDPTARAGGRPYVLSEPPETPVPGGGPGPRPSGRLLLVAGAGCPDPAGLAAFAERSGIPLLADPLSRARRGAAAIAHYDLLLRDPGFTAAHRPEFIARLGDLPTSKPLRTWLATLPDIAQVAFDPHGTWQDPAAVVGLRVRSGMPRPAEITVEAGWLDSWRQADAAAHEAIEETLGGGLSEPAVARELIRRLPEQATLSVASSMPIRDVEEFAATRPDPPRVLANRGANGIDGTISSAYGAAATGEGPVVLLIGDVALLHDIGGLLAGRRLGLPLVIVLLNNDGGGIFDFLPVSTAGEAYVEHVATPHGVDFAHAAALYGCRYERPAELPDLAVALDRALETGGTTLIEVRSERQANLQLHRRVAEAALSRRAGAAAPRA